MSKEEDEVVEKDVTMEKDLRLFSVEEVASFLLSNKLNAFVETFRKEEITGDMLMDICEEDLEEFNLGTSKERDTLLSLVNDARGMKSNKKKRKLPSPTSSPKSKVRKCEIKKDVSVLSVEDVSEWLRDRDLDVFVKPFLDLEISGEMLLDMSESDMNELSVGESKAQRSALFRAIQQNGKKEFARCTTSSSVSKSTASSSSSSVKRSLQSLSTSELGSWLESKGFGDFGKEFVRSDIDGDMVVDLCMDDSEDFPSLCRASDWESKWKSLISTIKVASSQGCSILLNDDDSMGDVVD